MEKNGINSHGSSSAALPLKHIIATSLLREDDVSENSIYTGFVGSKGDNSCDSRLMMVEEQNLQLEKTQGEGQQQLKIEHRKKWQESEEEVYTFSFEESAASSSRRTGNKRKNKGRVRSTENVPAVSGTKRESGGLAFISALFVFMFIGLVIARHSGKNEAEIVSSSSVALDDPFLEVETGATEDGMDVKDGDPCSAISNDGEGSGDRALRDKSGSSSIFFVRRRIEMSHNKHDVRSRARSLESVGEEDSVGPSSVKCDSSSNTTKSPDSLGGINSTPVSMNGDDEDELKDAVGDTVGALIDETDSYVLDHLVLSMKSHDDDLREEGIRQ